MAHRKGNKRSQRAGAPPRHKPAVLPSPEVPAEMLAELDAIWAMYGLRGAPAIEFWIAHLAAQELVAQGDWPAALQINQQLVQQQPAFTPAHNNLVLLYLQFGQYAQAVSQSEEILRRDPQNLHALANLTRAAVLHGPTIHIQQSVARLRTIPVTSTDVAAKQAEALSFAAEHTAILEIFDAVKRLKERDADPHMSALLYHLAAVASARTGHRLAARRRWQKALELNPDLTLAADNLADLDLPPDDQSGAWPYTADYWLPIPVLEELREMALAQRDATDDAAFDRKVSRLVRRNPALERIIPLLLRFGDPRGQDLALTLALAVDRPVFHEPLREFTFGQIGKLELRMRALRALQEREVVANGTQRMWFGGAWQEILSFGFELVDTPTSNLPTRVTALMRQAHDALMRGEHDEAEARTREALKIRPAEPSLINTLASIAAARGDSAAARALLEQNHARNPDYLFARVNLVHYILKDGEVAQAQALIDPLLRRSTLHPSEASALFAAQVEIFLAQGNVKAARSWLSMWQEAIPDSRNLLSYQVRVGMAEIESRRRKRS